MTRANARYIKQAQALLLPEIARYREMAKHNLQDLETGTLLSWMVEAANANESDPNRLAHLEVVTSLASIHTTQVNAVHVLLDFAARPEYLAPMRTEIAAAVAAEGGWKEKSLARLRKLDSFMKESQRHSPPSMLSNHRMVKQAHTLADSTTLLEGVPLDTWRTGANDLCTQVYARPDC